jgi:hypothetical protein
MKFLFAVAAAGILSPLTAITPANAQPANAQKDPACVEKCNRQEHRDAETRGALGYHDPTARALRVCIAFCPPAKKK